MSDRQGAPILGPMFHEKLYDPHDAREHTRWIPYNSEAAEMSACLEACKQILQLRAVLLEMPSPRVYAMLATPVLSLAEHTVALHKLLGQQDHRNWPATDLKNFNSTARMVRKQIKGPLRLLRNKLGAHHDLDALHPSSEVPVASAGIVLPPLANSLLNLILALNHDATFGYYRVPDLSKPREIQVMIEYPLASTMLVDERGVPLFAFEFRVAVDPRRESDAILSKTIDLYNRAALVEPRQPFIYVRVSDRQNDKFDNDRMQLRML